MVEAEEALVPARAILMFSKNGKSGEPRLCSEGRERVAFSKRRSRTHDSLHTYLRRSLGTNQVFECSLMLGGEGRRQK